MKQHMKRVSALLLTLCMVLSLVTPVSALDGQVQAERREGYDVATVHYTDGEGNEQAIPFTETASGYAYTLPEGVTEEQVKVEYFSTTRWDGAVDLSWYNGTDTEFTLTTPAQLAGLAALVNGQTSAETTRWRIKGDASLLVCEEIKDATLVGAGGGNVKGTIYRATAAYDFAGKTVKLAADMDMGGVYTDGAWSGPNWTPIGGKYPMDVTVTDTAKADDAKVIEAFFNGTLDGQGHRITNLYCDRYSALGFPYSQAIGLIGYMGELYDGETAPQQVPTVKNLSVSGSVHGRRMVGGIVGRTGDIPTGVHVENCANHADVRSHDAKGVGGVVGAGWSTGCIVGCYNTGNVSNPDYACPAGGICGNNGGMDIYGCYNVGTIESQDNRGRGIGGHDSGTYTVANCYYLEGCDNDPDSNGWYKGASTTCTIDVTKMTKEQMQGQELVEKLNQNGAAFVYQAGGYPTLFWEAEGYTPADRQVKLENSAEIAVSATASGTVQDGTVLYLSYTETPGCAFRYFTADGKQLPGDYYLVSGGDVTISAVGVTMEPGTILIPESDAYTMTVTKTGIVYEDGAAKQVTDYPVVSGDRIYEGDVLTAKATVRDGANPDDPDYVYNGVFDYTFAYQEEDGASKTTRLGTFTATASQATLKLTAKPNTTHKVWTMAADTSWYDESKTEFTITTARQLAGVAELVNSNTTDFAGKTIRLGADISLLRYEETGKPWWDGIGTLSKAFSGTFDGDGHTIQQMQAAGTGSSAALFTRAKNAVIENVTVIGSSEAKSNLSGIVSHGADTTIRNCVSRVDLKSTSTTGNSGGIAGYLSGNSLVENCVNYGSVSDGLPVGGIVGMAETGTTIQDCVNFGVVTGSGNSNGAGGVIGKLNGAKLLRCANYGGVAPTQSWHTGGVVGMASTGSITDCYNVAAVTGGHPTYGNSGVGGITGFFNECTITNSYNYGAVSRNKDSIDCAMGGAIGFDRKSSTGKLENLYYLDTTNQYASNSGTDERITAVTAADFATEDFLNRLNVDKCFVLQNGKYPELKMAADLNGDATVVLTLAVQDAQGAATTEKTFTRSDLKALASGGTVGYQFWKKGTENLVAATEYVTLDALLQSAGASFREEMYVTAADDTGFSTQLSYVDYASCRYYITADGDKLDVPAALALTWASGTGTLEEVAAKAENSGSIRFCYGISADQYGSAAGKRLVSGVTSVTLTACAHTGKTTQVPEVPATCTETGLTAGVRCADCGKVISGCETIPAKGHTEEIIPAVPPTETEEGWTEGVKCSVCGTILVAPQPVPVLQPVLTVTGQNADGETVTKGYSLARLKELEETTPIGYQYKLKRFTYIVAAVEYVPMDKLLADAGIVYGTGDILTASDGTKTSALGYQQSLTLNNGVNADGSTTVPVALALRWGENRFGFSDAVDNANSPGGKDTLRFCYGIGTELTAEDRLLDKTTTLTVSACTHADGVTEVPEVPATCTEDGVKARWVCGVCGKLFSDAEGKTETTLEALTIPAGHAYGEPVWTWNDDFSASATFTCAKDASHVETVTATVTSVDTTPATCTEDGLRTYTATVTFEGKEYTDTKTETVKATGHQIEAVAEVPATCETDGVKAHWVCNVCGKLFSDAEGKTETTLKALTIPATGHVYGEPVWSWNDDFSASATFTCANDAAHVETVNATVTSVDTTPATCEADGLRTYTATVTFEGKEYTSTKTEIIPATGHDTELAGVKNATCTEDGYTGDEVCKNCQTVMKKGEAIPALGHDYKDGKCGRCGAQDPNQPVEPVQPDTPATGDSSNMTALWIVLAVAGVGIIVLVVLFVTKRKNKKD